MHNRDHLFRLSSQIEDALQEANYHRGSLLHHLLEMATEEMRLQLREASAPREKAA
jgi:hypothetical protein